MILTLFFAVDETQSHLSVLLQSAQAGMFDSDSATSVVQVEISTTRDQLDRLLHASQMLPDADRTMSALLRSMKDLDVVVRSYGSLSDWSRSSILSIIEVLTPAAKETRTALALQWKAVTDLLRELFTSKLGVVHGMAMIMPMEGLALLALMERSKHAIMNGIPSISEKVQSFETEAKRLIDRVHVAAEQHPTQQELIEAALSSTTLSDVKTE